MDIMEQNIDLVTIREFEAPDKERVQVFFHQMGGETRAFFDRGNGNQRGALGFFEGTDKNVVRWLAIDQERMVGYVFLFELDYDVPWLGIAVAEDFKGRHLGRRLMQTAHEYARTHHKGGVLLTTHVANIRGQGLYERLGYERLGMHSTGEVLYLLRFKS